MLKKNDVAAVGTNAYFLRMWHDIMEIQIEKAFFFHQEVWKRNTFILIINDSVYEPNSKANLEKENSLKYSIKSPQANTFLKQYRESE